MSEMEARYGRYLQTYRTWLSNTNHFRSGWRKLADGADGQAWVENTLVVDGAHLPGRKVIWSIALEEDNQFWLHCSISRPDRLPEYADLVWLHQAFMPGAVALQLFVPESEHVNIHPYTLHLWAPLERPVVPDFTRGMRSI